MSKPRILVSKCLGFGVCRWDGREIPDKQVAKLKEHVNFIPVCPELAIGLGVPRPTSRLVRKGNEVKFLQTNTEEDVSHRMKDFADKILGSLQGIDAFILKDHSPSCGIGNVEVYPSLTSNEPVSKESGFFASEILKKFPEKPAITEKTFSDKKNREQFLDKVFKNRKKPDQD